MFKLFLAGMILIGSWATPPGPAPVEKISCTVGCTWTKAGCLCPPFEMASSDKLAYCESDCTWTKAGCLCPPRDM